jgi:hypothetical protein
VVVLFPVLVYLLKLTWVIFLPQHHSFALNANLKRKRGDYMLDAKQVIEKMNARGFSESMRSVKNGYEPVTITFSTMKLDGTDISCTVNLEKETFKFEWCVPYSINRLSTPDCGSFFNDEHFHKLNRQILKHVRILYWELQEG